MRTNARIVRLVTTSVVLAAALVPVLGSASVACATDHGRPYLGDFYGGPATGSAFYAVTENAGSVTVTIKVTAGHCVNQGGSTATYQTENGVALNGEDYTGVAGTTGLLCADVDGPGQEAVFCPANSDPQQIVSVSITNNAGPADGAVEPFLFRLVSGQPFGLAAPSTAPVHVIDMDGANRASLEPTVAGGPVVRQVAEYGKVAIPVFWAGVGPPGSVNYTIDPDPAGPATPGGDFTLSSPNPLPVGADRVAFINIDIVGDNVGEPSESATITLQPGSGYQVAQPSTTTFTILDNEESERPSSRLHHPRHGWRYKKSDYRIREVHVFTDDNPGGSGVVGAEFALRRNMKNGTCKWLTNQGWQRKDCSNRTWLDTQYDAVGELWRYRLNQLKSSVGTRIKNYTAFSRAIDAAGNVENDFAERRNANTFEIKRRR